MQNLSSEDQKALGDQVKAIAASDLSEPMKAVNVGLVLSRFVGFDVLKRAADTIKAIRVGQGPAPHAEAIEAAQLEAKQNIIADIKRDAAANP
jgi:hypothetical protein